MTVCAGTSRGVFAIAEGQPTHVLESRGVREMAGSVPGRSRAPATDSTAPTTAADPGRHPVSKAARSGRSATTATDCSMPAPRQLLSTGARMAARRGRKWRHWARLAKAGGWCVPLDPPVDGRARALVADGERLRVGSKSEASRCPTTPANPGPSSFQATTRTCTCCSPEPGRSQTRCTRPPGTDAWNGVAEMVEGNAGVFRSDDGGAHLDLRVARALRRVTPGRCALIIAPHMGLTVASAPSAFSHHCGEENGAQAMLFRSEDGGDSWRSLCDEAHSPSRANLHGLAVDPGRAGRRSGRNGHGEVWRVSNDAEWTLCAEGMPAVFALAA